MKRAIREHLRDFIAIILIVIFATATLLVILYNQKAALPAWVPGLGQDFYELNAELSSAQAVTPGQGQAIAIAGIQVGKVGEVKLEDGVAVVRMDIEKDYVPLIHDDATVLLRPKTGLQDMVLEVDPGTEGKTPKEGATIPLSQTQPNVNPDEFLAVLDGDTRDYLALLLQAGGEGLGGQGRQLSATLRRFEPFSRDLARIGRALETRRQNIARSIHNFKEVSEALGQSDSDLARFVDSSNAALDAFASQQDAIRESLRELPPTLRATQDGLRRNDQLSLVLGPASTRLIPSAQALKPALESTQSLFRETRIPIRDQIRPFTRQVRPVTRHLTQTARPLKRTSAGLLRAFTDLNNLFDKLAFNPPGSSREGFLFYLPWLNHSFNSIFLAQDSEGPLRRGLLIITCNTAYFGEQIGAGSDLLDVEFKTAGLPRAPQVCPPGPLIDSLSNPPLTPRSPGVDGAESADAEAGDAEARTGTPEGTDAGAASVGDLGALEPLDISEAVTP